MSKKRSVIYSLSVIVVIIATYFALTLSFTDANSYVYEFDASSAEECTSVEKFDQEAGVCFFECSGDKQCAELLAIAESELDLLLEVYGQEAANRSEEAPVDVTSLENSTVYFVSEDETISVKSGQADIVHQDIWQTISLISPNDLTAKYIEAFVVYSDDSDDTIAYVEDQDGNGKFDMGFNLPVFLSDSKQQQSLTIVHELAHIVTLNQDQATLGICEYQTLEGCFGNESMLARFVASFWSADDLTRAENKEDVFTGQEESFVTEYAASSPEEDIAESFAYYVVKSNFSGETKSAKKQSFFNDFDYAKSLKADMRKAILDTVIRARVSQ